MPENNIIELVDWNKFSHIYYICDLIDESTKHAFASIDLTYKKNFQFYYQVDNPYYSKIYSKMQERKAISTDGDGSFKSISEFVNSLTIYNLLQDAKYREFNNILVINKVDFSENLHILKKAIDKFPFDFDVVSLSEKIKTENDIQFIETNAFKDIPNFVYLSNAAIKYLVQFQTQSFKPFYYYMSFRNTPRDYAIKRAFSSIAV